MATIASLPPELLAEVFGYFQHHLNWKNLVSYSLVCRAWREPAQHALLSVLHLDDVSRASAWLNSPARGRYRVIRVECGTYVTGSYLASRVWKACSDLVSLKLDGSRAPDGGYAWCAADEVSELKSLHLIRPQYFPSVGRPLQLRLRRLDLSIQHYAELDPDQIRIILSSSRETLTFLSLTSLGYLATAMSHWIDFFTAERFNKVQHISLGNKWLNHHIWTKFSSLFPSLRTLEIAYFTDITIWTVGAIGTARLEALSFGQEVTWEGYRESHFPLSTKSLTATLHILRLPALARLRNLTFREAKTSDFVNEEGIALLDECAKRSICVVCGSGYLSRDMVAWVDLDFDDIGGRSIFEESE